ncbi:MAG: hypothetical protein AAGA91_12950 [Pseudomonadota bacterium]
MKARQSGRLLAGLATGWMLVGMLLVVFSISLPSDQLSAVLTTLQERAYQAWRLVELNLRSSVYPFVLVLCVYFVQFRRLFTTLKDENPQLTRVVRGEQSLDLCASLFFGIGVVWTAIGMRDALLFALGDQSMIVTSSAFSVLQRLVEGGVLLALSTTIVGAVGGYLMRIGKSTLLGARITEVYTFESRRLQRQQLASLARIEALLEQFGQQERDRSDAQ